MTAALSISQLVKTYDNGHQALKGVDLTVAAGDFFALLGPNGAGKSTTLGIVSSLVNKTSGTVKIFVFDVNEQSEQAKRCLGVVPQEFNFNVFEGVEQILLNQAGYYGINRKDAKIRAEKYLKKLDLWEKRAVPARQLSGGMKRRLMIARAMMHEPKMLILDEPTAGVDIEIRRSMWAYLQELNQAGTTIILTTHYLEEAESLCRNVAIINKGDIVINTSVKALLTQLNKSTFMLDAASDLPDLSEFSQFSVRQTDKQSCEFDLIKGETLNAVIRQFDQAGIQITSLRPKSNRLEELFIELVQQQEPNDVR